MIRLAALSCLLLTGCATVAPPAPLLPVSATLREPCPRPDRPAAKGLTVGALAGFSVQQEGALTVCEARRAGLVELLDGFNTITHPKPWWRFGR